MNWMLWLTLGSIGYSIPGLYMGRKMANDTYNDNKKRKEAAAGWYVGQCSVAGMAVTGFLFWPLLLIILSAMWVWESKPIRRFFTPDAIRDQEKAALKKTMLAKADKMVEQGKDMQRAGEIEIARTLKDASDEIYKKYGQDLPYIMKPTYIEHYFEHMGSALNTNIKAKYYDDNGELLPFGYLWDKE